MVKAKDLVELNERLLKSLSEVGVKSGDYKHIGMFREYEKMVAGGAKKDYVKAVLAERYGMSESSVYRVVRRLSRQVKI